MVFKLLLAAGVMAAAPAMAFNNTVNNDMVRLVVGGSLRADSPVMDYYKGFPAGSVKFITAAGTNPVNDATNIGNFFKDAGIEAEWIPVYSTNCAERTFDPQYVKMVEDASAIYMSGGQSGRVQSCLFGNYNQMGAPTARETPFLTALKAKTILGGSSAGAMCQPQSEILITGHSVESYQAVYNNEIFWRQAGNGFLTTDEVADVHFSERGRQGRLIVFAADVNARWAFGADENTAYEWSPSGIYTVVGQNGVVINENSRNANGGTEAIMHYLNPGDKINVRTGQIEFATQRTPCRTQTQRPSNSNNVFSGLNYRNVANEVAKTAANTRLTSFHGNPAVQVTMDNADVEAFCSFENGREYVSFKNMRITQGRASDAFINTVEPELPQDFIWPIDN